MFQWFLKRLKMNRKGFTLVELVVVIAILGVLAAIAVPKLGVSRKRAAITAHNANVRTLMSAATMFIADGGEIGDGGWTATGGTKAADQPWASYLQEWPSIPKGIPEDDLKDAAGNKYSGDYKVTVDSNDNIVVEPVAIGDNDD